MIQDSLVRLATAIVRSSANRPTRDRSSGSRRRSLFYCCAYALLANGPARCACCSLPKTSAPAHAAYDTVETLRSLAAATAGALTMFASAAWAAWLSISRYRRDMPLPLARSRPSLLLLGCGRATSVRRLDARRRGRRYKNYQAMIAKSGARLAARHAHPGQARQRPRAREPHPSDLHRARVRELRRPVFARRCAIYFDLHQFRLKRRLRRPGPRSGT